MKTARAGRLAWAFCWALAWASPLAACKGGGSGAGGAETLRIHLNSEPVSLDPHRIEDGLGLRVAANLMDGLMGYDGGGELVRLLAESMEVGEGGRRYAFKLRPGARWSDGREVTAEDFVAGFRRALAPSTGAKLAPVFDPIRGAEEYRKGKGPAEALGVRADGAGRVVFELRGPTPYFPELLALPSALPAREDVLSRSGGRWEESAPVTGRYRIASHRLERGYELAPNDRHWSLAPGAKPAWPPVSLVVVGDDSTAVSLFEDGKLDVMFRAPATELARLAKKGFVRTDPFLAVYFLGFNTRKPPFNDRDLRRAVAGSIRKAEITEALGAGDRPARGFVPLGLEGGLEWPAGPEGDSAVFADSVRRVRARGKLPAAEAALDASGRNSMIMEKVQRDVRQGIGLPLELRAMDWKSYVKALGTDAPPMYRFGWVTPFRDPILPLKIFTTGDPNNATGFSDAEYDRLVAEIERLAPGPERLKRILKAQEILVDREAVVIPLYHYVQTSIVAPRVTGFRANVFGGALFAEMGLRAAD